MAEALVLVESNTTGTGRLFAERARTLGLTPHLLATDPGRYGYAAELGLAVTTCDTGSVDGVLAACARISRDHVVVGVVTSSEYFVETTARAAHALHLPGEQPARIAVARDKGTQRRCLADRHVASPAYAISCDPPAAVAAARQIGLPVVVKPTTRSGSLGVRRCDTLTDVATHAATVLGEQTDERGRPLPTRALVEAYLPGPEFSVEVVAGTVRAVVAKHVDESLGFLEIGHDVPGDLDAASDAALRDCALAAVAALGLTEGAAHVEIRLVGECAYVIEVNPRLAGGMIPAAIQAATGADLITELVARAAGRAVPPTKPGIGRYASIRFVLTRHGGTVIDVPDAEPVLRLDGIVDAAITARPGQRAVRTGSYLDRLGHVIAVGADAATAARRADRAAAELAVAVRPDQEVLCS